MEIGDILYLIAIVIAGIYGVFSSGKKKKRPDEVLRQPGAETSTEQDSGEKGFWEIFEEVQQKKEPAPVPTPAPAYESAKQTLARTQKKKESRFKSKEIITEKKKPEPFMTSGVSSYQFANREGSLLGEVSEDENYVFGDESFNDPGELRKAIIYTEILNRRY